MEDDMAIAAMLNGAEERRVEIHAGSNPRRTPP